MGHCPPWGWLLQRFEAHDEARKPVTRAVGEGASDDFEAGAFEEGLGAEEDVVGAGALVSGSGVGLYDRSAVLKRILCRRPNEGHGDPLATCIPVNGYTGDYPNILIVYPGCGPGLLDAGKLAPGGDGNPAYGVFSLEGEEPRGVRASGQVFHSSATALRAGPLAGELLPLGASDSGEHAPASAAPASPEDDPHAVQQVGVKGRMSRVDVPVLVISRLPPDCKFTGPNQVGHTEERRVRTTGKKAGLTYG